MHNNISNIIIHNHEENKIFNILKCIDDKLYDYNLPNIINIILMISIVFIIKNILKRF
jgi:hypothetical protein